MDATMPVKVGSSKGMAESMAVSYKQCITCCQIVPKLATLHAGGAVCVLALDFARHRPPQLKIKAMELHASTLVHIRQAFYDMSNTA